MIPSLISMLVIIGVIVALVVGVQKSKKNQIQTQDYWKLKLAEAEAQEREFKEYAEKVLNQPKKRVAKMKAETTPTEKKKQTKKPKSTKKQKTYEMH
jgi:hypothetical protein